MFKFPVNPQSSDFGSAVIPDDQRKVKVSPPSEERQNEIEADSQPPGERFIRHKQTGSGDSGFQESVEALDFDVSRDSHAFVDGPDELAGIHMKKLDFSLEEGEELEDEDKVEADTTTATHDPSGKPASRLTELVGQIKAGADQVDTDQQAANSPSRSRLKLDFGNFLRPLRRSVSLSKSPSSPVLSSFHNSHTFSEGLHSTTSPFGSPPVYAKMRHFAQSPMQQFHHMPLAKNPYMSPLMATDEQLRGICPVYLVVS